MLKKSIKNIEKLTSVALILYLLGAKGQMLRRNGKSCYPLMDGISKMPCIFSRTEPY